MIGHELTTMFGIDHAQSLAIILPSVWTIRKDQKRKKLLQYAERIWDLTEGDDEARIELAIQKTRQFFEDLGVGTRLNAYGITKDKIDTILKALEAHRLTALSETRDVTLDISRTILEDALGE
ncbi:iron-containing alcohol dehydrogenase [bacterium]|nr:iron-containing alcohol dehydrogenase [bacterium]